MEIEVNTESNGNRLEEALGTLPRRPASRDFTGRVLAELETRGEKAWGHPVAARAAIAAGLLALAAIGLTTLSTAPGDREPPTASVSDRAEILRREHRQLVAELEELKRRIDLESPTLYLASDRSVDLVVDVAELAGLRFRRAALGEASRPNRLDIRSARATNAKEENAHERP